MVSRDSCTKGLVRSMVGKCSPPMKDRASREVSQLLRGLHSFLCFFFLPGLEMTSIVPQCAPDETATSPTTSENSQDGL